MRHDKLKHIGHDVSMPIIRHDRLVNQQLATPSLKDPVAVLKSLLAVQGQDYPGAKWALGQRTVDSTDDDIEQSFTDGRILRLHVMRPTWHFVTPEDIRWLVELTAPRINAVSSHYYRKAGLDEEIFRRSNAAIIKTLQGGQQKTRSELREAVAKARVDPGDSMRFGYIMHRAELDGVVCSGGRKGNQFTYALVADRAPHAKRLERDEALSELALSYFTSRGPATLQDYVWWSGLTVADAKRGIEISGRRLKNVSIEGRTYWLGASAGKTAKRPSRRIHLLPAFDEYFIAYKDRSASVHAKIGRNDTSSFIFQSPIVVDGQVVGSWKRVLDQKFVRIQLKLLVSLPRVDKAALINAAEHYANFLKKEPLVEFL